MGVSRISFSFRVVWLVENATKVRFSLKSVDLTSFFKQGCCLTRKKGLNSVGPTGK